MKMHYSLILLLVGAWTIAADPARPDVSGYRKNVEVNARNETDATLLFEDGQARLRSGKYGTAALAFQTLIAVYPESRLVARATDAMRTAERLEEAQSNTRTVRSLRFENLPGIRIQDVLQRFEEREIELAVEKPCNDRTLAQAKVVLTDFLAESGMPHPRVELSTRELPPRSVEIIFRITQD
jgi:hypothetical protein